jgi:anti-sigma B factor antagonist
VTDELRFRLEGEIDAGNAPQLQRPLLAYAERCDGEVVIDCGALDFIDSSGLRVLVDVARRNERTLVLVDLAPRCRRVFEVAGLDSIFELR